MSECIQKRRGCAGDSRRARPSSHAIRTTRTASPTMCPRNTRSPITSTTREPRPCNPPPAAGSLGLRVCTGVFSWHPYPLCRVGRLRPMWWWCKRLSSPPSHEVSRPTCRCQPSPCPSGRRRHGCERCNGNANRLLLAARSESKVAPFNPASSLRTQKSRQRPIITRPACSSNRASFPSAQERRTACLFREIRTRRTIVSADCRPKNTEEEEEAKDEGTAEVYRHNPGPRAAKVPLLP